MYASDKISNTFIMKYIPTFLIIINCPRTKFEAIIANVCVFYANFWLDSFCSFVLEYFTL